MDKLTINQYLNFLLSDFGLKNDAALCRAIRVLPSSVCKLRKGRIPLTAMFFCRLHEHLGVSMAELRASLLPAELSRELQAEGVADACL